MQINFTNAKQRIKQQSSREKKTEKKNKARDVTTIHKLKMQCQLNGQWDDCQWKKYLSIREPSNWKRKLNGIKWCDILSEKDGNQIFVENSQVYCVLSLEIDSFIL